MAPAGARCAALCRERMGSLSYVPGLDACLEAVYLYMAETARHPTGTPTPTPTTAPAISGRCRNRDHTMLLCVFANTAIPTSAIPRPHIAVECVHHLCHPCHHHHRPPCSSSNCTAWRMHLVSQSDQYE